MIQGAVSYIHIMPLFKENGYFDFIKICALILKFSHVRGFIEKAIQRHPIDIMNPYANPFLRLFEISLFLLYFAIWKIFFTIKCPTLNSHSTDFNITKILN